MYGPVGIALAFPILSGALAVMKLARAKRERDVLHLSVRQALLPVEVPLIALACPTVLEGYRGSPDVPPLVLEPTQAVAAGFAMFWLIVAYVILYQFHNARPQESSRKVGGASGDAV